MQEAASKTCVFQRFAAGEAVNSIVKDLLHVPLWQRVVRWIERMLKCFCINLE